VYFGPGNVIARFDTQKEDFADGTAWSTSSLAPLWAEAGAVLQFCGAIHADRYLYFPPCHINNGSQRSPFAVRVDTSAFDSPGAWSIVDLSTVQGGGFPFTGGASDGRFVYFASTASGARPPGEVARYDPSASFTDTTRAWTFWRPPQGPITALGAAFDGDALWFFPLSSNGAMVRMEPGGNLSGTDAWRVIPFPKLADGGAYALGGGASDGRFLYVAPGGSLAGTRVAPGVVAQFDTHALTEEQAWSSFDTTTLTPPANGFFGALFDGEYVYFIPYFDSVIARFDARSPAALPPGWGSSFF
jgi:hypothetical protein